MHVASTIVEELTNVTLVGSYQRWFGLIELIFSFKNPYILLKIINRSII